MERGFLGAAAHLLDSAELKGPRKLRFWVRFRSVLGRFSAKVGPGTVTNGPGLINAA